MSKICKGKFCILQNNDGVLRELNEFGIPREQRRCFNWKNLQPLFSIENARKNNFYKFDVVHEIKLHFIT
jgi:hypothetical protein